MSPKGLELNVMIEGQEGLTWERWQRLARAAEDGGFAGLYRSDHLTGLFGDSTRPSLETWASLPWLATATRRIRFGPIVSPLTFYQPALLAKRAAAIDQLAGGRFDLGIGAGWNEMEHRMFGIPFPPLRERMDRLEAGRPRDPRALAGHAGDARAAVLAARRRAELPPPGGRAADRRGPRRAADDARRRRARRRVERDARDLRRVSAEARGPRRPLPRRRPGPGDDPAVADGARS